MMGGIGQVGGRRMTPRVKAFLDAYGGVAQLNATEAARLAGFKHPAQAGHLIRKRWAELVAEEEQKVAEKFRISDEELDRHLSEIARNSEHRDRLRALELIARMKGRLNDKLKIEVDRKGMLKEIEQILSSLQPTSGDPTTN